MSVVDPEESPEDSLIDELVSYDEYLRNSQSANGLDGPPRDLHGNAELEELKQCANLLEQLRASQAKSDDDSDDRTEPFPSVIGHRIGKYVLQEFVGQGAFGVVYRALDEKLKRNVAIKLPRQEVLFDRERLQRFEQEATTAASLDHPLIVPVLDAELSGSMPYIASVYCDGPDLGEWLENRQQPVPATDAARFVAQLAGAVDHAHREGVLHRDLKPSNVLLAAIDNSPSLGESESSDMLSSYEPRLTDFGLAKLVEASLKDTRSSLVVGTPLYMAPEQMNARRTSSHPQTDVYALGILLYELLTLKTPFDSPSYIEVLDRVRAEEPTPIASFNKQVPRDLIVICEKCLRKRPEDRYATARELENDLVRFSAHEPISARSPSNWDRFSRWCSQPERITQAVFLVFVLQLVMIGWVSLGYIALGQVLQGSELSSDRVHLMLAAFGVHIPLAVATWLGVRYRHWFFYIALMITFGGHIVVPVLGMRQSIRFIEASYNQQEYFLFTNFGLVFLVGAIQAFALTTALLASRRREQLEGL